MKYERVLGNLTPIVKCRQFSGDFVHLLAPQYPLALTHNVHISTLLSNVHHTISALTSIFTLAVDQRNLKVAESPHHLGYDTRALQGPKAPFLEVLDPRIAHIM